MAGTHSPRMAQLTISAEAQPSLEGKIRVSISGDVTDLDNLIGLLKESIKTVEASETAAEVAASAQRARLRLQRPV